MFIIVFGAERRIHMAYIGVGIVLLVLGINNFIIYFKKHKKQCKEESASAKLKFKGE